jgi:hypothetical protein
MGLVVDIIQDHLAHLFTVIDQGIHLVDVVHGDWLPQVDLESPEVEVLEERVDQVHLLIVS